MKYFVMMTALVALMTACSSETAPVAESTLEVPAFSASATAPEAVVAPAVEVAPATEEATQDATETETAPTTEAVVPVPEAGAEPAVVPTETIQ